MSGLDRDQIQGLLPHRDPFLFLDRVVELEPGVRGVAETDITERMCAGHFPGFPVLPGVLMTEALAQLCAVVALAGNAARQGKPVYLVGLDKLRFRRPVRPGDVLITEARFVEERRKLMTFEIEARVGDERAVSATLIATAPDV
jgi:3-hydroxyacyl-[acyl-carrier-protein] dehydratase